MPKEVKVEAWDTDGKLLMTGPVREHVDGNEPFQDDPRVTPAFNGSSPSGDITARSGLRQLLPPGRLPQARGHGHRLAGKIVLCRYGGNFRGVKVYIAQQSTPPAFSSTPIQPTMATIAAICTRTDLAAGDGRPARLGSVHVQVSGRRAHSRHRLAPGPARLSAHPTKPGDQSADHSLRTALVSRRRAHPRAPGRTGRAARMAGCAPLHLSRRPGVKVHMLLKMDYEYSTIWDVIGTVPGTEYPNEWVVAGNHRDAWVYGAVDPDSGPPPCSKPSTASALC